MPLGYHVILRLGDDRVIAPSAAKRRRIARHIAELSRTFAILSWKLADTHLHLLVLGKAEDARELIRRLRIWFTSAVRPGVPLEVARRKPINGQSHLESVFHYALRQDSKHGIETDTLQDASAVSDILGLRGIAPEIALRVREHLPRLTRPELLAHLGLDDLDEAVHLEHLAEAAKAAFGLSDLGADSESSLARRAAVAAAKGCSRAEIATALGVTVQSITRLSREPPPARHVRAVRLQMGLRAALAPGDEVSFVREPTLLVYTPAA